MGRCPEEARVGDKPDTDGDELERGDEDHDLLTFAEGGIRLREEIALTEAALREAADGPLRTALRARLEALTDALARNTRQARSHPGETGFLTYTPPARRDDADGAGSAGEPGEGRS